MLTTSSRARIVATVAAAVTLAPATAAADPPGDRPRRVVVAEIVTTPTRPDDRPARPVPPSTSDAVVQDSGDGLVSEDAARFTVFAFVLGLVFLAYAFGRRRLERV